MTNIIYPKHTANDLKKFQKSAIHSINEENLRKLYRKNNIYLILELMVIFIITLFFMTITIWIFQTKFFPFGLLTFGLSVSSGVFTFGMIGDIWNKSIHPKIFSQFKKAGCEYPRLLEKDFSRIIQEAERIETFCGIIKSHPDCILEETENYDIRVKYVENNFQRTTTFTSDLITYYERIAKGFVLDFSYLNKHIDKYLSVNKEE